MSYLAIQDASKTPIAFKLANAARIFRERFGATPRIIKANAEEVGANWEQVVMPQGVRLVVSPQVPKYYYWAGWEDEV